MRGRFSPVDLHRLPGLAMQGFSVSPAVTGRRVPYEIKHGQSQDASAVHLQRAAAAAGGVGLQSLQAATYMCEPNHSYA